MPGNLFIQTLQTDPRFFFAVVITVVLSITLHELAHGLVAMSRGDRTPEESGHLTLNPLVHMGGMSLIALAVAGIAWGAMPINPSRMRGRYAEALVALAGPATNLLLGFAALTALGGWMRLDHRTPTALGPALVKLRFFLLIFGGTNWLLCLFNLLPIPPLDGSHVLANLSGGYRDLVRSPGRQWLFSLLFLGIFFFGTFLADWAYYAAGAYLKFLRGL